MANTILTIGMITREALRVLSNELTFTANVNRNYDDRFARSGAKIGNSIDIRKPARYDVRRGAAANPQGHKEEFTTLTLDKQIGVDVAFSSVEETMELDDYSERVIRPAVARIANEIDTDGLKMLKRVYNQVGSVSAALTGNVDFLNAGVKLDQSLAPRDGSRKAVVSPVTQALLIGANANLFNPSAAISEQYKKGQMATALGFDWFMDQNIPSHTVGAYAGTGAVDGAGQTGSVLVTDGWGAGSALNEGDVFTIAGVFSVNPQSKAPTKSLQQFVVAADVVAAGGVKAISISPAIVATGPTQNVSAVPADGALITVSGTAGEAGELNVAFHKDAFVFGCADLVLPKSGIVDGFIARDEQTGLSIRTIKAYDVMTDQLITRMDVLYGWGTLYENLAVRVAGK
jgi:hypothetical protein